jgi:hypothetical protein
MLEKQIPNSAEPIVVRTILDIKAKMLVRLSKEARKAGYFQTSHSAIVRALEANPSTAVVERAKWYWAQGMHHEAMNNLNASIISSTEDLSGNLPMAKRYLLLTRWLEESQGLHSSAIVSSYLKVTRDMPDWEKGDFFLGRYYNSLYLSESEKMKPGQFPYYY